MANQTDGEFLDITAREAMRAMLTSASTPGTWTPGDLAAHAYDIAEAMLRECRARRPRPPVRGELPKNAQIRPGGGAQ